MIDIDGQDRTSLAYADLEKIMARLAIGSILALIAGISCAADGKLDPDLEELQGKWEFKSTDGNRIVRMEKHVTGKRETVRIFVDDELVRQHSVDIAVERLGGVKVFRWKNGLIEAGPAAGNRMADGACVSRVPNDCWNCAFGMLEDDEQPVAIQVFQKVKANPANAAK